MAYVRPAGTARLPIVLTARSRPLLHIALLLLVILATLRFVLFVLAALAYPQLGFDFSVYFAAALALRDNPHANIYSLHVLQAAAAAHSATQPTVLYLYPPMLAVLLLPLTLFSYPVALHLWIIASLLLWLFGAALLAGWLRHLLGGGRMLAQRAETGQRSTGDVELFSFGLVGFLALFYGPLEQGLGLGQVTIPVFAVVAVVPWLLARGRERTAGVLLGLATLAKVFPAVLILYYIYRGRWRVPLAAAGTLLLATLATLPLIGVDGLLATRTVLANGGANSQQFHNQSLARAPLWLAAALGGTPAPVETFLGYALLAMVLAAFLAGMARVIHQRRRSGQISATLPDELGMAELLGYSWALCSMVLVMPITWEHHDAWLLPAVVVCLGYATRGLLAERRRMELLVLAMALAAYVLTMNPLPLGYESQMDFSPGPFIGGHPIRPYFMLLRPLAALLLWATTGWLYLRFQLRSNPEPSAPVSAMGTRTPPQVAAPTQAQPVGAAWPLLRVTLAAVAAIACWDIATAVVVAFVAR